MRMHQDGTTEEQRGRGRALNVLAVLFGLTVALVLAELASRLVVPSYMVRPHPKGLYVSDPDLGYVLAKNYDARHQHPEYDMTIHTSSDGLRGKEITSKSPDTFRILVLGDSIAWGYGVDLTDSFPHQLEQRLNDRLSPGFEVLNAAIPGYGTAQELVLLQKLGLDYEPDLVIVGLFVENDAYDNLIEGAQYRRVVGGYLVDWYRYERNRKENPLVPVTAFLSQNSHLYVFLRSFVRGFTARGSDGLPRLRLEALPEISEQGYLPVFAKEYSPEMERGMALTKRLIGDIQDAAAARDAEILLILFPSQVQVYPDLWADLQTAYRLDGDKYALAKPNAMLGEFAAQHGIPMVDLLADFREAGRDTQLYYRTDLHQNAAGQALAAEVVYEGLLAQGLVPQ